MSNMRKPVPVPEGVEVEVAAHRLKVEGPLGELEHGIPDALEIHYDTEKRLISVSRRSDDRQSRSLHGLYRTIAANMVEGVARGFQKNLEIHGMGYNVAVRSNTVVLQIGFCHAVVVDIPEGIQVEVEQGAAQPDNPARLTVKGRDKEQVGQFAAELRAIRPPEPYKGKGIRYGGEHVRRKAGKAFAGLE